ncbi:hypothetical protein PUNSTDRAFT_81866, partial [Punctularia strigosozonata HHB-11173 SS5]|uniref:uncharacterized protein n=1 Tax=Punctularia strigosozonata (strain HHB-11173) TaxID=741275 RepID=UPI00044176AA
MTPNPALSYSITASVPSRTASASARDPAPTAPPPKRRRTHHADDAGPALRPRQTIVDQDAVEAAKQKCEIDSGNDVVSCFPTGGESFPQHEWATFVWNSRRPQITQQNLVDIFLFRADSGDQILHFANQLNPFSSFQAGSVTAPVNDSWFGAQGENFDGTNTSFPFFWVLVPSGQPASSGQSQPIFSAIQTTVLDSVASSLSSASSLASLSSASAAAAASSGTAANPSGASGSGASTATSSSASGNLQHGAGGGGAFPHWAIAVIVVLGFFAILASVIVAWLLLRRMRSRRRRTSSAGQSMNSASPMMAEAAGLAGAGAAARSPPTTEEMVATTEGGVTDPLVRAPSTVPGDGASEISRAHSESSASPFSGADAAIMAEAFRKALRKPDFAAQTLEEGESPDSLGVVGPKEGELLNAQLKEEGRDIRSVGSSRGVRVENLGE